MEQWKKDARKEPIIIDIDSLVPADHLLRKIEKVMDAGYKTPWIARKILDDGKVPILPRNAT